MANEITKYKEIYLQEFSSHTEEMGNLLLEFEKTFDADILQQLFRIAHTLKGNAATMKYEQTTALCHAIEDLLADVRDKKIAANKTIDVLFKTVDILNAMIKKLSVDEDEINTQEIVAEIRQFLKNPNKEFSYAKPRHKTLAGTMEKIRTIQIKVEHLDTLMKLAEELLVNRLKLNVLSTTINNPDLTQAVDTLEHLVTEMQYNIMQVRLLPLRILFARFPRMIRDLAKQQNKEIVLQSEGADIELDRALLDELAEALTHLVRNAVDHGIETVSERIKKNKNPQGTICLIAKRTKESAHIELNDDGRGLNWPAIKAEAVKRKIVKPEASMDEVAENIYKGISTSKEITSISGRGLGLAIAKQKIESIGGSFIIKSKEGNGLTCLIKIPLTLAVIKVLFVNVNDKVYAIPIDHIDRLLTISVADTRGLFDHKAIIFESGNIPIIHLAELFGEEVMQLARKPVVIVSHAGQKLGICVDKLLSTEEVVIKPLNKVVKGNRLFSGSALIGSGKVVLIVDVAQLLTYERHVQYRRNLNASV